MLQNSGLSHCSSAAVLHNAVLCPATSEYKNSFLWLTLCKWEMSAATAATQSQGHQWGFLKICLQWQCRSELQQDRISLHLLMYFLHISEPWFFSVLCLIQIKCKLYFSEGLILHEKYLINKTTSLPYFSVKLSCVCLMLAYIKKNCLQLP